MKRKMRCRECFCYNYDFISNKYEVGRSICGLHGGASVDPDGIQRNLDNRGGCGFIPKYGQQLTLF